MGNMSYCRFENTYKDLRDCLAHLDENLSEAEEEFRRKMINLCRQIVDEYGDDL